MRCTELCSVDCPYQPALSLQPVVFPLGIASLNKLIRTSTSRCTVGYAVCPRQPNPIRTLRKVNSDLHPTTTSPCARSSRPAPDQPHPLLLEPAPPSLHNTHTAKAYNSTQSRAPQLKNLCLICKAQQVPIPPLPRLPGSFQRGGLEQWTK